MVSKMEKTIYQRVKEAEKMFGEYEITAKELARTRSLRERLEDSHMTVSVIGQFKRGKSAVINRILQREIMPVGIVPVTAVVTMIDYGEEPRAYVHFANGMVKDTPFEELSAYVNEQENRDNHLKVSRVEVTCPSPFLEDNLTLVDTPGVGSLHEKNTKEAYSFVTESDAVIFTFSVDSPLNRIETDFLLKAKEYASKFYFAVNKTDMISKDDLEAYLAYCREILPALTGLDNVRLFPVSARTGEGIDALKDAVASDMRTEGRKILEESSELKLRDIVLSALAQIKLYRSALSMTGEEFEDRFKEMNAFFDQLKAEAKNLPEALKKNPMVCELHANDVKNRLAEKVTELFGIDYSYDIEDVEEADGREERDIAAEVTEICDSLLSTLNEIFMYREENTYIVSKRIYHLNDMVRKLVRMRDRK